MSNARNVSKLSALAAHITNLIGLSNAKASIDSKVAEVIVIPPAVLPGTVFDYAGTTAPEGYLFIHGQAVSRTTYAALFAVIGTTYGAGDGSTTFNLPDARGRVVAGKDDMGGSAASRLTNSGTGNSGINGATLGATGGTDRHTLTTGQLASHSHGSITDAYGAVSDYNSSSAPPAASTWAMSSAEYNGANGRYTGKQFTLTSTTRATSSAGTGEAHPNVQPTIVLNKIIKT